MEPQEKRRLLVFAVLVVLFDAVMAVWYGLTGQSNVLVACMFTPMLSVILTRLVTGEGTRDLYLAPRFRGQVRWYLAAWFATPLLVYAGALLYFVVFPQDFDPMGSVLAAQLEAAAPAEYAAALAQVIPLAVLVNPLTGLAQAFGEEFAWRGYLLPKLAKVLSPVRAVLATGVIWGLWHAPLWRWATTTAQGTRLPISRLWWCSASLWAASRDFCSCAPGRSGRRRCSMRRSTASACGRRQTC